jgi:hypothetical protein
MSAAPAQLPSPPAPERAARAQGRTWRLVPHFIVRRTGFPFELLESLRMDRSAAELQRLVGLDAEIREEGARLLAGSLHAALAQAIATGALPRESKQLRAARRLVHRRERVPPAKVAVLGERLRQLIAADLERWNGLVEQRAALRASAEAEIAVELADKRQALRAIAQDERFREAVFLSNPDFFKTGLAAFLAMEDDKPMTAKMRQVETTVATYLQRFCAKNDTCSFFGPVNYARAAPGASRSLAITFADSPLRAREAFFAYWAAADLARKVSEVPEIQLALPVRRSPLCRVLESGQVHVSLLERTVRLSELQRRVFDAADGSRTSSAIGEALGLSAEVVEREVQSLAKAKLLLRAIEIAPSEFHPLRSLIDQLRQLRLLPGSCAAKWPWLESLAELESARREFAGADLRRREAILGGVERQFERLSGGSPRRRAGQMYADRTLLYEDCLGSMERVEIGGALFEDLAARIALPLRVAACHARLLRDDLHGLAVAVHAELASGAREVAYGLFAQRLKGEVDAGSPELAGGRARAFLDRLHRAVACAERGPKASLSSADLSFLAEYEASSPGLLASPDLMIAARSLEALNRGELTIVMAELHDNATLWDTLMYFHPERDDVERHLRAALIESGEFPDLGWIQFRRESKCFALKLPGTTVELSSPASGGAPALPVSDLTVVNEGGCLALRSRSTGRALTLYCGLSHTFAEHVLSLPKVKAIPWATGAATPRVDVEGVVVQRRRWRFDAPVALAAPGAGEGDLLLAALELRARHGLPEHVFASAPAEPKPIYVDFANPFLVRLFAHLARSGGVVLEEMLPGPDELWLVERGSRFCLELRTTAFFH